jgi:hypothetical protein
MHDRFVEIQKAQTEIVFVLADKRWVVLMLGGDMR